MDTYRVTWTIEVDAPDHEGAAREALRIQRDPESIATAFDVQNARCYKDRKLIDLYFGTEGAVASRTTMDRFNKQFGGAS